MIRTGTICASFLYTYLTSEKFSIMNNSDDDFDKKKLQIQCLSEVFANSGGVLSKISQVLNIESGNLDNKVFSECKPYNEDKTINFFINEMEKNEIFKKNIVEYDKNIYKSGSIGQVHKGKLKNGQDIIFKVQYYGLYEQFKTDIKILHNITNFLYTNITIKEALKGIEIKLYEELDYKNEYKNHKKIYELWKDNDNIIIANIIDELCTDKIITVDYVNGESLSNFIQNASIEEKNNITRLLIEFLFRTLFKHSIFYSDIHYGNFLIVENNKLCITDFGSLNYLDYELLDNLKSLYLALYNEDKEMFYVIIEDLCILKSEIEYNDEEIDYFYNKFKLILEPFLYKGEYDFKDWNDEKVSMNNYAEKWGLPSNLVHFTKISYGLLEILCKMGVILNFSELFIKYIENID